MTNSDIYILLGCEESQAVCIKFRQMGFSAFSCDTKDCTGGHPEWHLKMDVHEAIKMRYWHCGIFFPPCTDIAVSGAKHFEVKRKDGRQQKAIDFFMSIVNCGLPIMAIENPIGVMSTYYRESDQIIQPYHFGDTAQKPTCLWLTGFPKLFHNSVPDLFNPTVSHVGKGEFYSFIEKKTGKVKKMPLWYAQAKGFGGKAKDKSHGTTRSKTFNGIAKAMSQQWGGI